MRAVLLVIRLCVFLILFAACSPKSLSSSLTSPTLAPPALSTIIPLRADSWSIPYDGFGFVNFASDASFISYAPQATTDPATTYSVLLLTNKFATAPISNFRATIVVTTVSQLRTPTPNAWETFWFFFNYKLDANNKKMTNYFTLKPNGFELGTAYDETGQTFLITGSTPTLTLGISNTMVLEMFNGVLNVTIDGNPIFSYDNNIHADKMYIHPGNFGLYCKDAEVHISSVKIEAL